MRSVVAGAEPEEAALAALETTGRTLTPAHITGHALGARSSTSANVGQIYVLIGIHEESNQMPKPPITVPETRQSRAGETEKIAVNMGVVDLGQVDLLIQEGFYSNRSDLVRTAVRNQLAQHVDVLKQTVARRSLTLGLQHFSRADLERAVAAGERLQIEVVGLARIAPDVTPALAKAAIASVSVLGAFQASAAVRQALSDRIH